MASEVRSAPVPLASTRACAPSAVIAENGCAATSVSLAEGVAEGVAGGVAEGEEAGEKRGQRRVIKQIVAGSKRRHLLPGFLFNHLNDNR